MTLLRFAGSLAVSVGGGVAALAASGVAADLAGCGGPEFVSGSLDGAPAPMGDGGPAPVEASEDAGAPLGFCATMDAGSYVLCSDFDEVGKLPSPWSGISAPGAATLAEDSDASVSPPSSLLVAAPAVAAGDTATALLTKTQLPKGIGHIEFQFRLDALSFPSASAGASVLPVLYERGKYILALALLPATSGSTFSLAALEIYPPASALGAAVDAGTAVVVHPLVGLSTKAVLGTWEHVDFDFNLDAVTNPMASVTIGGGVPQSFDLSPPPTEVVATDRSFSIGLQVAGSTNAVAVRFDNVLYVNR